MESSLSHSCRGCLRQVPTDKGYSLHSQDIKILFEKCTSLEIPMGGQLPEKICSSCYHNCKVWHSFRAMCHENHQHLFLITTAPIESVEDLSSLEIKAERIIEGANVVESAPEPVQVEVHPMVQLPATPTTIESRKQPPVVDPATPTKSTGKTNGVWDCPVCKTKLSPCVRLRDHLKVHLSEDDPCCPICQQKFSRSSKVYSHIMSSHLEKGSATTSTSENELSPRKKQIRISAIPKKNQVVEKEKESETLTEVVVATDEVVAVALDNGDILIDMDESPEQISIYTVTNDGELENVSEMVIEEELQVDESACDVEESADGENEEMESDQPKPLAKKTTVQTNGSTLEKKFGCEICDKKFARRADCKAHKLVHSKERNFACPHCDKTFSRRGNLTSHQAVHSEERPFVCEVCHKTFTRIHALARHKEAHTRDKNVPLLKIVNKSPLTCPLCSNDFPDYELFKKHVFAKHVKEDGGETTCSKCSYKAEDGKQLFEHLFGEHLKDMSLFCSHCDFQGTTPSAVLLHLTENHGYDKEMCPQCGKVVRNLPQHKIIHNPQLYRQHKCDECGKGFVSNVDLRRHEMIHSGLKPHACTVCGKRFALGGNLKHHIATHKSSIDDTDLTAVNGGNLQCPICNEDFNHINPFISHIFTDHVPVDGGQISCSRCKDQKFENGKELMEHLFIGHMNCELSCKKCLITKDSPAEMERHLNSEHDVPIKMCPICGERTAHLNKHKSVHVPVKEKQHRCDECGKGFRQRSYLKAHMEIHDKGKSLECKICNGRYRNELKLARHSKLVHDIDL